MSSKVSLVEEERFDSVMKSGIEAGKTIGVPKRQ